MSVSTVLSGRRLPFLGVLCGLAALPLAAATLAVDGRANIFAAGRASAFNGLLPPSYQFVPGPGKALTFSSVTGQVTPWVAGGYYAGPDGGIPGNSTATDITPYQGISGIVFRGRALFLVGVFLDDSVPQDPAPARLDFTGRDNFQTLSPEIRQTFFIGDGLTGTGAGARQQFLVPPTATRLFLGFADAAEFIGAPGWYDDNGGSLAVTFELTPAGVAIATSSPLPAAMVGATYSHTLAASGGTPPYRWSVSAGSLPPGLSLDAATGTLSGKPETAGSFTLTVRVTDNTQATATATFTLAVNPAGAAQVLLLTRTPADETTSYLRSVLQTGGIAFRELSAAQVAGADLSNAVILAGFASVPSEYSGVAKTIANAVSQGSWMIALAYGRFLLNDAGIGTAGVEGWGPVVLDSLAYVKNIDVSPVFEGLPTWDPPAAPEQQQQLLWNLLRTGYQERSVYSPPAKGVSYLRYWALSVTPNWRNLPTNSSYCQAWGGCVADRTVVETSIPIIQHGAGKILAYFDQVGDSRVAGGPVAALLIRNFVQWKVVRRGLSIAVDSALPDGFVGISYTQSLTASGGVPPYRWSLGSGSLPAGLSLDPSTGLLSGTPATRGRSFFVVRVTDSAGAAVSQSFSLLVPEGRPCVAEPTEMTVSYGDLVVCEIAPAGDTDIFRFTGAPGESVYLQVARLRGTGTPALRLIEPDGTIGGWAGTEAFVKLTKAGTHAVQVAEDYHDETVAYSFSLERLAPPSPSATPIPFGYKVQDEINPAGDLDLYYFRASAGDAISARAVYLEGPGQPCFLVAGPDGELVSGWTCGAYAAEADIRLTRSGIYTLMLTDSYRDQTVSYRLEVQCFGVCQGVAAPLAITTASPLPDARVGTAYSHTLAAAGGTPPYRWSLSVGSLPPSLALNSSTGVLSGAPTVGGVFSFTVEVADASGARVTRQFTLSVVGGSLVVGRSWLIFTFQPGDPPPVAQWLTVSASGGALGFTAAASTSSGGDWLAVTPASGATPATLSVLVNPAGLAVGIYSGTVTITAPGAINSPQRVSVQLFVNRPGGPPQVFSVVNGASMQPGPVAPGTIVTVFGSNLGPPAPTTSQLDEAGQMAKTLGEVEVLFDNIPAPLVYVQASQLSAIVPYAVAGTTEAKVQVRYKGVGSNTVTVPVAPSAPGIFTVDATGKGPGAILNQNYTVNAAANAAERGAVAMIYATGEGETDPQVADGRLATAETLPKPRLPVSVKIGGLDAEVLYAGAAPGMVVGLLQVNVRVPPGAPAGSAVPVVLTVGNASSQPGVTMAVR